MRSFANHRARFSACDLSGLQLLDVLRQVVDAYIGHILARAHVPEDGAPDRHFVAAVSSGFLSFALDGVLDPDFGELAPVLAGDRRQVGRLSFQRIRSRTFAFGSAARDLPSAG